MSGLLLRLGAGRPAVHDHAVRPLAVPDGASTEGPEGVRMISKQFAGGGKVTVGIGLGIIAGVV